MTIEHTQEAIAIAKVKKIIKKNPSLNGDMECHLCGGRIHWVKASTYGEPDITCEEGCFEDN